MPAYRRNDALQQLVATRFSRLKGATVFGSVTEQDALSALLRRFQAGCAKPLFVYSGPVRGTMRGCCFGTFSSFCGRTWYVRIDLDASKLKLARLDSQPCPAGAVVIVASI